MKKLIKVILALYMLGGIVVIACAENSLTSKKTVEAGKVVIGMTEIGGTPTDRLESDKLSRKGRVYLVTEPRNATVRILNIRPKFYNGIDLDPGTYHVEVSANGYETQRMWVYVAGGETNEYSVHLKPFIIKPLPRVKTEESETFEEMSKLIEEYQRMQELAKSLEEYQRTQEMVKSIEESLRLQELVKSIEESKRIQELLESFEEAKGVQELEESFDDLKSMDQFEIPQLDNFDIDLESIQKDIEKYEKFTME